MRKFDFRKYADSLLFALAIAVLVTILFYSLSRGGRDSKPAVAHVVFTHWWHEDIQRDVLLSLAAEFEDNHEGIRIILNEMPYESLRTDLFNFAGDDETLTFPGDVLALDPLWVPELINRGVIESAEIPILSFINVLYYNIDILREAGFTRPPRTRSEFLTFARAVAANEENRIAYALGFGLGENSPRGIHNAVYPWIWAAGARLVNNGNPVVTSAPVVQSFSFLATLSSEGLIAPGAFYADNRDKLEDFVSGRTAFMIASTRYIGLVRERMGDAAFNITSVPILDNQTGTPLFASLGWTLGIHSASAHNEEARLFSAFLAGRAAHISDNASGAIPASPPPDPFYSNIWEIALAGETAVDFSGLADEPVLEEIFREKLASLFAGTASPAETAAAIQERWLAILREAF